MTADELMQEVLKMKNDERIKFLELMYNEYYDTGISPEQLAREIRILEAYNDEEDAW